MFDMEGNFEGKMFSNYNLRVYMDIGYLINITMKSA
jgi:hypothetical protein